MRWLDVGYTVRMAVMLKPHKTHPTVGPRVNSSCEIFDIQAD